jgi:hypothetical protein
MFFGVGGGSHLGPPTVMDNQGTAGNDAAGEGNGGSGAGIYESTTGKAGGDGAAGVVIITAFYGP